MNSLKEKVIVITGAGSGIGRELAIQAAHMGARMAIADIDQKCLAETALMLPKQHETSSMHVVDVSKREAVYRFAHEVIQQHHAVDVLVNNAGVALSNVSVEHVTYEDLEWVLGINLWGVIHGTKAFLPYLLKQPEANLVNVSSLYGLTAVAKAAAYCTSKFAVRGFTESLRQELRRTSVAVTLVHPGGIRTNIARNSRPAAQGDLIADPVKAVKHFEDTARTSAADAARQILDGIKRNAPRILIGSDAKLLDFIARVKPASYDEFMMKHVVEKAEKSYQQDR